ncbi:hypothetical protein L3X38_028804 [Prunus dulcis]|uniref:Endoplasmic reticulum transmembrane protein n=1 Tax=Prunus dulcis TaxID=3755 RepID=A0AAD4Z0S2_PRUDU|nr:hypothetical protein L3X38_028804 [Prunus dulcis]
MALQWMILTYLVAAEAALAFLLTLPAPKLLKNQFVSLLSLILQPALFIFPFAGFQLLGNGFQVHCLWIMYNVRVKLQYSKQPSPVVVEMALFL